MKGFLGKSIAANIVDEFDEYLRGGGFPKAVQYDSADDRRTYIESVVAEIFKKDIRRRIKIRNFSAFQKVQTYLINNFGATTSLDNKGDAGYAYVQACMTMMNDRKTEDREYAPLEKIRDNYPKYVLTRNDPIQQRNGIIHANLPEFMRDGTVF